MTNDTDVLETIAEYERVAIGTGEWQGTVVEFSNDGVLWLAHVMPTEEHPLPALARATVHRRGVKIATTVTMSWVETVPGDEEWYARWLHSPHVLFGSAAARAAYRRAFRDVIGERRDAEETLIVPVVRRGSTGAAPTENWGALFADAATPDDVLLVLDWARERGELTDTIQAAGLARAGMLARQAGASDG